MSLLKKEEEKTEISLELLLEMVQDLTREIEWKKQEIMKVMISM
jgi:hypothetical protein